MVSNIPILSSVYFNSCFPNTKAVSVLENLEIWFCILLIIMKKNILNSNAVLHPDKSSLISLS